MATKRTKRAAVDRGQALDELHAAYVSEQAPVDGEGRVQLRHLAAQFGVPFGEADRSVTVGRWQLEREWHAARRWLRQYGRGARTEEEYCVRLAAKDYVHLCAAGPEGRVLALAHGRETWRRIMAGALQYEAHLELQRAKEAFDVLEGCRSRMKAAPSCPSLFA